MHGLPPPPLVDFIKFTSIENRVTRGAAKADCIIPHIKKPCLVKLFFPSEHHISGIQYHNQLENVHNLTHLSIILRNGFFITNNVNINVVYIS